MQDSENTAISYRSAYMGLSMYIQLAEDLFIWDKCQPVCCVEQRPGEQLPLPWIYYQQPGAVAINKTAACRGRNPPRMLEMDWSHYFQACKKYHKICLLLESTRKKEKRLTKKHPAPWLGGRQEEDRPFMGTAREIAPDQDGWRARLVSIKYPWHVHHFLLTNPQCNSSLYCRYDSNYSRDYVGSSEWTMD